MRLILDCNVLISAGWKDGVSRAVFLDVLENHDIFLTRPILEEYRRVISYAKFHAIRETLDLLLDHLLLVATMIHAERCMAILPDQADVIYLDAAVSSEAHALVTGNTKHFPFKQFARTLILSPSEFLRILKESRSPN